MDTAVHPEAVDAPPSVLLGALFAAVAQCEIAPAKDWADAVAKAPHAQILAAYRADAPATREALAAFVHRWFDLPREAAAAPHDANISIQIEKTWRALVRPAGQADALGTLLALPHPSVAPGGRFRECYYWDCYFTLVGLRHRPDLIRAAADNFSWQVQRYGFVPTANRTYYLSRSQPPLLFKIVELLAEIEGEHVIAQYLPTLVAEHRFWMDGAANLDAPGAKRRVVRLKDGVILNRYWDDRSTPRDESYVVDTALAQAAPERSAEDIYRNVRAACESGWDFTSRWVVTRGDLRSIITTSIVPMDLNSILYGLECFISRAMILNGDKAGAPRFEKAATQRRQAMHAHLWNQSLGAFDDLNWSDNALRGVISAAMTTPLFFGVATPEQARRTATLVEDRLLAAGGVLSTTEHTDLQWDAPNGWAPLQWYAAEGLERYGFAELAAEIRGRWISTVERVFRETGRLVEKYDVVNIKPGSGGEYALQDGFGWTNGVTKAFLER